MIKYIYKLKKNSVNIKRKIKVNKKVTKINGLMRTSKES